VARQLEVLVTDGSVRISTFSTMTRAIDQALQALRRAQQFDDELDLIRVYIAARDALLAGNFNPCVGILFAYRSVAASSATSAGRNTVQESVTRLESDGSTAAVPGSVGTGPLEYIFFGLSEYAPL